MRSIPAESAEGQALWAAEIEFYRTHCEAGHPLPLDGKRCKVCRATSTSRYGCQCPPGKEA